MLASTPFSGLFIVEMPIHADERGSFTRLYCRKTFREWGLEAADDQWSLSRNPVAGTLRGLHYQAPPSWETKLVRCTHGAIFDVVVDMRQDSPAFGKHFHVELSARNQRALYVPTGFAHGFMTLEADTEILYGISPEYTASKARGLRWNDPALRIPWPMEPALISSRDAALPLWATVRKPASLD
ncbi:dTDP-4-dehydrorhamnose 3,5-epimerase [Azospirillum cavernae]|uniref:dTDP-4-dehydrorhamnose 3,5-epimerase n=1 Tax=Azospirillum cavernae TaxID=2320860 RepID=A0A418VL40_9PROT|nr:dTDP-4-dehydrorhamnose 3,5-epimerase [Azospirillum cavernae]RJF76862.1 dTDP-4-dehydrorhamnose 3,5-epimerase [Azospirillum cavernae]